MSQSIPAVVLGASGYVGGEILRLVAAHPYFELANAVSASFAGQRMAAVFRHLAPVLGDRVFAPREDALAGIADGSRVALFCAAPHGAAATAIASALAQAASKDMDISVVDSSADFRYTDQALWESVYGQPHGAPELLDQFVCGLPEHSSRLPAGHVGHPGCFATATLLAAIPLMQAGLTEAEVFVSGVTGSTGSGRSPQAGTHHPERNSNLYAYKPLAHRHAPEVAGITSAVSGRETTVHFVPHSGPFARGIHVTLQARSSGPASEEDLRAVYRQAYADAEFVQLVDTTPRLKDVVASNLCHIGVATDGESVVVMSAIDNLVKGAAGGAIQWMNRLCDLPDGVGLTAPAPGWT